MFANYKRSIQYISFLVIGLLFLNQSNRDARRCSGEYWCGGVCECRGSFM